MLVLRTYQNCIFLSLFITFDGFHPFFSPSCSFCIPLFVTSAQTALSSAYRDRFLVVLTNRILHFPVGRLALKPPYRKGFDIPASCNRSICAPYTILYIMYARAIQPVTGPICIFARETAWLVQYNGWMPTGLLPAVIHPWTLPRAKKVSTGHFFTLPYGKAALFESCRSR